MRITMKRFETENKVKTGFFSSKMVKSFIVHADVELSETEVAIIRQHNLGDTAVYEYDTEILNAPYHHRTTIDDLINKKGIGNSFHTPLEANNFEHELKSNILPTLKSYIEGNTSQGQTTETFEL